MESKIMFIFYSLETSILKYPSTSSTMVSYFFLVSLGDFLLGWCSTRFRMSFFIWIWVRERYGGVCYTLRDYCVRHTI